MILKVIKTYESNKVALVVAIESKGFARLESSPAYLTLNAPVQVGDTEDIGDTKAVIVERQGINEDKTPMLKDGVPVIFKYWVIGV